MNLYHCNGFRSVRAEGILDAAEVFARRAARRAFGRRGIVRTLNEESYAEDFSLMEFSAFIGYPSGFNETTGRNVRFTVRDGGAESGPCLEFRPRESVPRYINEVTDYGVSRPLSRSIRVF